MGSLFSYVAGGFGGGIARVLRRKTTCATLEPLSEADGLDAGGLGVVLLLVERSGGEKMEMGLGQSRA
jgi:hypothetical protein